MDTLSQFKGHTERKGDMDTFKKALVMGVLGSVVQGIGFGTVEVVTEAVAGEALSGNEGALSKIEAVSQEEEKRSTQVEKARAFFEKYMELARVYDSALADLYSEEAVFDLVWEREDPGYPSSTHKTGAQCKDFVRTNCQVCKPVGVQVTFSNITYHPEGESIHVEGASEEKVFGPKGGFRLSRLSFVIMQGDGGKWFISKHKKIIDSASPLQSFEGERG
jgi:hypothetical protein